jgi:coproporphyrinogen III oxidase
MTRPTVPRVAEMASIGLDDHPRAALARTVDGLGFPRWKDSGFTPIGGSTFSIDGRPAATVAYARGVQRITDTIVSGARHINYAATTQPSQRRVRGRQVELNWILERRAVLTFKRSKRTVVLTATPATPSLAREMYRLATRP